MAEAPPPFDPMPRSSGGGNRTLWIILLAVGIPCCGVLGFLIWGGFRLAGFFKDDVIPMMNCDSNFVMARDAMLAYAKDNGDKLPPAATWQTDIEPYYKKLPPPSEEEMPFKWEPMPSGAPWGCTSGKIKTGMAYNSALAGKKVSTIENPDQTVLLYEVPEPKVNASAAYKPLPKDSSPKIFGEPRGWFTISIYGGTPIMKGNRGSRVKIEKSTSE